MKTNKFIQYLMLWMSLTVLFFHGCKNDDDTQPIPAAPTDLEAVTFTATSADLKWRDNSSNETGFRLERKDADSLNFKLIKDLPTQSTTFSDAQLNPGITYQYRIMAYNAVGESGYSNTLKITTLSVAPNKPLELKLKVISSSQIDLSWIDDAHNENGFKLERGVGSNPFEALVDLPKDSTAYQDKGLSPNTLYHYRILAYNNVGNSEYSNIASDTTINVDLKAPTDLTADSISANQINLTWQDNNDHETGFILERASNKSIVFLKIADLIENSTTYKDSEISPDTYYRYRIKTYNTSQESGYSETLIVKTDDVAPIAPTNLVATPSTIHVKLRWEDNSDNELGFIIERATGRDGEFIKLAAVNSNITSYLDDNLSIETEYIYRIHAYNTAGKSGFSDKIPATTFTFLFATSNASFSGRFSHTAAAFDDKLWVIGGIDAVSRKNDVWHSSDGETWVQATSSSAFSARFGHTTVVFDGKLWVIGGDIGTFPYKNDVWYSTDGVTWTEATSSAAFSGRRFHTTVVFHSKLWVIGGTVGTSANENDVWYSTDGVKWIEATTSTSFSARFRHATAVFNDKLWVIGGDDGARKNDVWYSADGVAWTEATASAPFSKRVHHTTPIFGSKLWVIGGLDGSYKNDVWFLP
ncbi:fibronectin type III domain-containing protein [Fulvivirgaceae bacterium BMA12]|uniref:Fibronectin type III domain-containing protein n=1 Tax=Agaribacillus aureus TaxID=3051825 RepID=A0ABT8LGB2_9BACT|nr:fibronectin type III domain-containing protein [Fulvivirgaceae bacterium BMA12]